MQFDQHAPDNTKTVKTVDNTKEGIVDFIPFTTSNPDAGFNGIMADDIDHLQKRWSRYVCDKPRLDQLEQHKTKLAHRQFDDAIRGLFDEPATTV